MDSRFHDEGLDFTATGYFSEMFSRERPRRPLDPQAAQWEVWEHTLGAAVHGDFGGVPALLAAHEHYTDYLLRYNAALLLEDMITDAALVTLRERMTAWDDPLLRVDACHILATVGRLSDVPTILDTYEHLRGFDEADTVTIRLSWLLEPELGEICLPEPTVSNRDYRALVLARCEAVRKVVPDPHATVFLGAPFSVPRLADAMLRAARGGRLDPEWRQRFEAAAGIDCSPFYVDKWFRPLRAAAMLEDFLAGLDQSRYLEGRRYFFGRPVP